MTILIADSGSTKTAWRLIDARGSIQQLETEGYNPYLMSEAQIQTSLENHVRAQWPDVQPDDLFFYGAGCGAPEKRLLVEGALRDVFPKSKIEVEHDLLGAARALCGRTAGMAAILGTGSNSCYYDGETIVEHSPSLGWVLGDEGSGSALGRELARRFCYNELSPMMRERFIKRFDLTTELILDRVYKQPMPNRFLASFSKFIFQNIEQEEMSALVIANFRNFFRQHIRTYTRYREVPLHITGSVGFYYSNILRRVAEEEGVMLGQITENPIAGLSLYHHPNAND